MIYFNQNEASKCMGICIPTFRKYKNLGLIPKPEKERFFPVNGRKSARKEKIYSKNVINNSIIRIKEHKKINNGFKPNCKASPKSILAYKNNICKQEEESKQSKIFNDFMNIRIITGQI